jgi:phosphatidylglycerol:prolipoprotein diacylglycerol transferase
MEISPMRLFSSLDPELIWGLSLIFSLACALYVARRDGLDTRAMYWAGVFASLFGLWGGYLLGLYYHGTDGRSWAWLRPWSGGEAEYGGLLTGMLAVFIYLRIRKQPFLPYADAIVPAVAFGVAIGRIGCFLNGDDFGTRSNLPWAVTFPPGTEAYSDHVWRGWLAPDAPQSLPVHPVQLYMTFFALALFVFLATWHPARSGVRFGGFLAIYGGARFLQQFLRGDFQAVLGPFSLTQLISVALIILGLTVVYLRSRHGREITMAVVPQIS